MNTTVFLLLRLGIGVSMFGHGLVRLPKINAFSDWMTGSFAKSMLPLALVRPFSMALPFCEFIIGILLLAGLWTEAALLATAALMLLLLFGTAMVENWEAVPSQLIHLLIVALLIQFISSNTWAVDKAFNN
ncbi:MAG: DoxX family membrane protein [Dyadobacter sp.]|uniref:DoxX family membrane protein n=1 Tax=Dyadobacter sp. TaxID=1914288 RepID=UPI001B184061|nr:DoxX family membrane protein [Dyadobacter sp.]MBO9616948.1 DoxX family membrane protein [Dyadobacter sp.]